MKEDRIVIKRVRVYLLTSLLIYNFSVFAFIFITLTKIYTNFKHYNYLFYLTIVCISIIKLKHHKLYNSRLFFSIMPHQCVRCSRIIPAGSREILEGCKECKSHFFFYIKDEQLKRMKDRVIEIPEDEKEQVEEDIREMVGIEDEQAPVILDVESIRVTGEGKFEIDIAKIFRKDLPIIYKLEEGKYIIDLASTLKGSVDNLMKNPYKKIKRNRRIKK